MMPSLYTNHNEISVCNFHNIFAVKKITKSVKQGRDWFLE